MQANWNIFHFSRIYLLKKPYALIVCLALLMNPNMLQLLLIEIWSAKFHVMILQVHNVLVTKKMIQLYLVIWLFSLAPILWLWFICHVSGRRAIYIFIQVNLHMHGFILNSSQFQFLLQGCVIACLNIALLKLKKSYLHVHIF